MPLNQPPDLQHQAVAVIVGHQIGDERAVQCIRLIVEQIGREAVGLEDSAIAVEQQDSDRRVLEDTAEPRLAAAQLFLGVTKLADVLADAEHAGFAVEIDLRATDEGRDFLAGSVPKGHLDVAKPPRCGNLLQRLLQGLWIHHVREGVDALAEQRFQGQAGPQPECRIDVADHEVALAQNDDAVGTFAKNLGELRLAAARGGFGFEACGNIPADGQHAEFIAELHVSQRDRNRPGDALAGL